MNPRTVLKVAVASALAAMAGFALASPDIAQSLFALMIDPHAGALLAFGPAVRALQSKQADVVASMQSIVAKAEADDRDLNADEQAKFGDLKASKESLSGRIARAQDMELAEAQIVTAQPLAATGSSIILPAASRLSVSENIENDPGRGFRSLGEFARSVHSAWRVNKMGAGQMDSRLASLMDGRGPQAAAPSTFGNEATGADGGFLIPPGFSQNVFSLSLTDDSLLPYCDDMPIDGNIMMIPKDEATPWGSNGPRAYWQGEAQAGTATKPSVGLMSLRLKKLLALTPISDEMLADTSALSAYLPKRLAMSIRWKTNEAILFGAGGNTPLGALAGPSLVTQAKDAGQATLTLTINNLLNMFSRLPPGSFNTAVWLINNTVIPALGTITLGNYPIFLPVSTPGVGGAQPSIQWTLLGRPVLISQHAKAFSAQGDVILADLSYYQCITKAEGVVTATSMHLYFDADAMAFRVTFRMDGEPKLAAPITPANGSTTLSPFVQLAAR